jgi:hypothetical protein
VVATARPVQTPDAADLRASPGAGAALAHAVDAETSTAPREEGLATELVRENVAPAAETRGVVVAT